MQRPEVTQTAVLLRECDCGTSEIKQGHGFRLERKKSVNKSNVNDMLTVIKVLIIVVCILCGQNYKPFEKGKARKFVALEVSWRAGVGAGPWDQGECHK